MHPNHHHRPHYEQSYTDNNAATYNDTPLTAVSTDKNSYYTAAYNNDTKNIIIKSSSLPSS